LLGTLAKTTNSPLCSYSSLHAAFQNCIVTGDERQTERPTDRKTELTSNFIWGLLLVLFSC